MDEIRVSKEALEDLLKAATQLRREVAEAMARAELKKDADQLHREIMKAVESEDLRKVMIEHVSYSPAECGREK